MLFMNKLIEGEFFRSVPQNIKYCWGWIWDRVDFYCGLIARIIFAHLCRTDNNKVFFMTQESAFTCNPKYIYKDLHNRFPNIDVVWRTDKKRDDGFPYDVKTVRYNSFDYFKEIFTAKIIVANSFIYLGLPFFLKKDQVLIQTWHGSLGLKKHSKEVIKDNNSKKRIRALIYTGKRTDYLIVNSQLESKSLGETYWIDTKQLMFGHPRNDILFDSKSEIRRIVKNKLFYKRNIDNNIKIVMYAPTFRDHTKDYDCYKINYDLLVSSLSEKFGGEWCVLERYHPAFSNKRNEMKFFSDYKCTVIDVTDYPDMQELISITDVAITDYSSWIFDFLLTRKPGFIFATDIEEYCKKDRGFYYPISETPFLISSSNEELNQNIFSFDYATYNRKVEKFLQDKGCVEDGHAAQRVVDLIVDLLNGNEINDVKRNCAL